MANEITVSASLEFTKDGKTASLALGPKRFTMTGGDYVEGTLTATTTPAALNIGGIGTEGWLFVINQSASVDVQFGVSGGTYNTICAAGGIALFKVGAAALYHKTASDTAEFQYLLLEE